MKNRNILPDLTGGSIIGGLFRLSLPIVFANILQTAYQLTDTFWVGRLGEEAVAAVSLSFPVIFLLISLGGGLAIAGAIMVAQYKGGGNLRQVDYVSAQTLWLMAFVSVVLSVLGYFTAAPIMHFLGAEDAVFAPAVAYLKISFLGMIFLFTFFMFQSLMRGVGDVKTPLLIVLGTVLLNLVLDPLLILGFGPVPAFGVSGAAMATVFTQGVAAVIGLFILFSGKYGIHFKKENLKPDFALAKKMFFLGFPASMEQATRALGMGMMFFLVADFGTAALATYGIGTRILSLMIIPALGMAMATATFVGQNIGAGKKERAEEVAKTSTTVSFVFLTLLGAVIYLFAEPLSAAFIPDSPLVIQSTTAFIKVMALSFGFMGLQQVVGGVFMGAGDTTTSMLLSVMAVWVFRFPLAYLLSRHTALGEMGIWYSFPISNVLSGVVSYFWFLKGDWKNKKIVSTAEEKMEDEVLAEAIIEEGV